MAEFKKLFYALGLAALLSCISAQLQGGPYVPRELRPQHTVAKPKSDIIVIQYDPKTGEIIDFDVITNEKTSALFSLFPLIEDEQRLFDTGIVLTSGDFLSFTLDPPATNIVLDATDSVFDLGLEFAPGRPHQYLYLQAFGMDRMYRLPDMQLVELHEKVLPAKSKLKGKAGWNGRGGGFKVRSM